MAEASVLREDSTFPAVLATIQALSVFKVEAPSKRPAFCTGGRVSMIPITLLTQLRIRTRMKG
jgi:hypothetical protein